MELGEIEYVVLAMKRVVVDEFLMDLCSGWTKGNPTKSLVMGASNFRGWWFWGVSQVQVQVRWFG